jgi:uncharacterized protein YbaR (Trm112 family)
MAGDGTRKLNLDEPVLRSVLQLIPEQLACPVCLGDLRLDVERLLCAGCGHGYPIVDGIPVLIAERASEESRSG